MNSSVAMSKARDFYDIMQVLYGHKFISQFNGMTDLTRILSIISGSLAMLTDEQFEKGLAHLNAKAGFGEFCPTLSDFKTWCMAGSWWTAIEAWQRACDYSNQSEAELVEGKMKVTTLAKKAWDSVYWLVDQGKTKEAFNQFKSLYETYLAKAQMQGRQQEWYVPLMMITPKAKPVAAQDNRNNLPEDKQRICDLTAEYMQQGMGWNQAFKKAQIEVRGFEMSLFNRVEELKVHERLKKGDGGLLKASSNTNHLTSSISAV
ncbi:hypothetical protein NI470_05950 [Acinetobacter lwoffii]|uniref:hypothetical protein n=1 Tax=Acinetobacter lwoffii TaxID=28090 RepID=UPI00209ADC6E|nr:hypothetical protein [Acinetobacter lwoffii]MCO8073037.1 hypothetical protein [Acinetobacter lwoffii]MCO8076149.1 hypothetical protein [Acinetobacter lwoffii]